MSASRPIAAAPPAGADTSMGGSGDSGQSPQSSSMSGRKPKRTLIESACAACRRRKSKCDGSRPVCSRCQALKTTCTYEAQEGESRWSALRRKVTDVESERDDLRELMTFLQSKPENEALDIFHRVRANGFEDLLRLIRHAREDGHTISQGVFSAQGMSEQQRLPSIRSMLETSGPSSSSSRTQDQQPRRQASMSSDRSGKSHASGKSDGSDGSYASNYSVASHHSSRSQNAQS